MQFTLADPANPSSTSQATIEKLNSLTAMSPTEDEDEDGEGGELEHIESGGTDSGEQDEENSDEPGSGSGQKITEQGPEASESRKKKRRIARLRRKTKLRAYEFSGNSDVAGVLFLEVVRITDLPPERNRKLFLIVIISSINF